MGRTIEIELTNDFHNTSAKARARALDIGDLYLSAGQVRRIRRELCGMADCSCGGELGERGRQAYEIIPDRDGHTGRLLGVYLAPRA